MKNLGERFNDNFLKQCNNSKNYLREPEKTLSINLLKKKEVKVISITLIFPVHIK